MSLSVPVNTMLASKAPSPVVKVSPAMPDSVKVPLATLSVTCRLPLALSTSAMAMWLPLETENTRLVSSSVVCALGTVFTGASLTALTVMPTVSVSTKVPPVPVLPRSDVLMVNVSAPL